MKIDYCNLYAWSGYYYPKLGSYNLEEVVKSYYG